MAGIAIAEIALRPRRRPEPAEHIFRDPARPIAAPREPERDEARIVRHREERFGAPGILAGEMAPAFEALRMEDDLGARKGLSRQRRDLFRPRPLARRSRPHPPEPHPHPPSFHLA